MALPKQIREPGVFWPAAILSLILIVGVWGSLFLYDSVENVETQTLKDNTETLAQLVYVDNIYGITGTAADAQNVGYQNIQSIVQKVHDLNYDVDSVRILGIADTGRIYAYADSNAPVGSRYGLTTAQRDLRYDASAMSVFETGNAIVTYGDDSSRIFAFAPVLSNNNMPVAVVSVGVNISSHVLPLLSQAGIPMLIAFISVVGIIIFYIQRKRQYRYISQRVELLSIASHEIRTPLTGMKWAWDNYIREHDATLDPGDKDILKRAVVSCDRVIDRIGDLLDSSATGRSDVLHRERVAVRALFERVVMNLDLAAQSRNIGLDITASIQPTMTMYVDPGQIYNIFFNLLTNAIKYTKPSTVVSITYERKNHADVFHVTDKGNGMTSEEIGHIFEGYYRTQEAQAGGQVGTGLGLFLVKKAVEMQGGDITVTSVKGEGSTFTVTFPDVAEGGGIFGFLKRLKK